ncbi:MobF family relaxase [Modestobacter sp. DSM 44400]|uniref:MobF family relaxase n=1 Tax=Modestobacter sp. DSM 44400 TaxID=1550230 RepID=UPI000B81161B|nr:MobF family relaxase [Modestobacter sp. DSM 44400]
MKVYAGAPAAARHYVEADRGRADDYYLAEGTGIARRYTAGPEGPVAELAPLTGDGYEAWVAGLDPQTGEPRGWLRDDDRAVRFVEVVVNGPKSWSLAAALHPDVAAAYDTAQDRAAAQIIGWLAEHATTRVGPRGGQVQVPVEQLEAVTVAHHTSRAGDPHRHLHLQINARVFAAGKWRGLHTVGVRDSLAAINGIGHAAVSTDPQFRNALSAHGYVLNADGEIWQLADFVGAFSARAAQIARNIGTYEREWTAAHPGELPGPVLRRAWDARAWADGRPDKVTPQPGANLDERWRTQLADLGYRDLDIPVALAPTQVGSLDRDEAVQRVLNRLAAGRSAWNAADVRGEVEQLIAAEGIVVDAAVRGELAEDLTDRALSRCVPLRDRDGAPVAVPGHVRAWTSQPVLDVEADLAARLGARGSDADTAVPRQLKLAVVATAGADRLDAGQAAAAVALAGDRSLMVIEGAAGAGKTTTLSAARDLLEVSGRRQVVVTPTLKAAKVAAAEVGTRTGSAAWLVFQYGWRWNDDGAWTRLMLGQADPVTGRLYTGPARGARLRPKDLLVVDEAGMLDQDTARALLTVADECQVRVALLGDRHQLAAVGRGGVLDLAVERVDPNAHLTLDAVHRFTRTRDDGTGNLIPDTGYADLTLVMRTGDNPGAVFDALAVRGQILLHPNPATLRDELAGIAAASFGAGEQVAVVVDTREQAAELNVAIRERLVAGGRVDDKTVVTTGAGRRIGAGDRIATRRNDRDLGVANRDTWTVTAVGRHGELVVIPADVTPASDVTPAVTPATGLARVLPVDYVTRHAELAYASTAHGVQGDTVPAAHVLIGGHTGAASAYVGMTRGRTANTAHLVAADLADAREQWIAVFARDGADLGPGHAAELAAREAARYAQPRPLEQALLELHEAWSAEQRCLDRLAVVEPRRQALRGIAALGTDEADQLPALRNRHRQAAFGAHREKERAEAGSAVVAAETDRIRNMLLTAWDAQRGTAREAGQLISRGSGRLGLRRAAVTRAHEHLADWATAWLPYLPTMPTDPDQIAHLAGGFDDRPRLEATIDASARRQVERAHPGHAALPAAAVAAQAECDRAWRSVADARREHEDRLTRFGRLAHVADPVARLAETGRDIAATTDELTAARARTAQLMTEPVLLVQPTDRLARERDTWRARHDTDHNVHQRAAQPPAAAEQGLRIRRPEPGDKRTPRPDRGAPSTRR